MSHINTGEKKEIKPAKYSSCVRFRCSSESMLFISAVSSKSSFVNTAVPSIHHVASDCLHSLLVDYGGGDHHRNYVK